MSNADAAQNSAVPIYRGQVVVYPSLKAKEILLVDEARPGDSGQLEWQPVSDPHLIKAALAGYRSIPEEGDFSDHVRVSTLRQYAANLMARAQLSFSIVGDGLTQQTASGVADLLMHKHSGYGIVHFAVDQGLEADRPCLAQIEHALAIATTACLPSSTVQALECLRSGEPSRSMFTVDEELSSILLQHHELHAVDLYGACALSNQLALPAA
ncbi:hypothetical protein [Pseudomonas aeruginosa]|jgi:hypothetical protein|uniref:hypothetical protein n=1 Tax=Pseudomonas aeruginosa TaxID=287 RepID=UPI003D26DFCB